MKSQDTPKSESLRQRLYRIIFEADTPAGRAFDIALLWMISLSVLAVVLESVNAIQVQFGKALLILEWIFTIVFTLEYIVRLYCARTPVRYAFSFYGLVDLLSILPSYFSFFITGSQSLLVIRGFRLLRVFRIFKLGRYTGESRTLIAALQASRPKITVFLVAVLGIVLVMGSLMYLIEGEDAGFTSIPVSVYWAITTITTVGYGDLVPQTPLGQLIASMIMISGYAIIAVPTGIVSVELANADNLDISVKICTACGKTKHPVEAIHCMGCGAKLEVDTQN